MIDYASLLYGPVFDVLGVEAVLTLDLTDAEPVALTVYDGTSGVEIGDPALVSTIRPVADVRATELAENSLSVAQLRHATLAFNGKSWTVMNHQYTAAPTGEGQGLVRLILEAA